MKPIFFFLGTIVLLSGCSTREESKIEADYLFENVHVIPMNEEVVLEGKSVAVRDGKIVAIVDNERSDAIISEKRVDGKGRYLMPGLSDMHVHVRWDPHAMFKLFLANGVTTVANMWIGDGGSDIDHLKLRSDLLAGGIAGPRYLVAGRQIHQVDLPNIEEIDVFLDDHVANGYDFVKVHGDLEPKIYDALMAEIQSRNLPVTGHAQRLMPLDKSFQLDAIEHLEEFLYTARDPEYGVAANVDFLKAYRANVENLKDPAFRAPIIRDVAASGIFVDATLIVYDMIGEWASDEKLEAMKDDEMLKLYSTTGNRDYWLSPETNPYQAKEFPITPREVENNMEVLLVLLKEFHDAGVPILSGTDSFGTLLPGFSLHQEFDLFAKAGLTPYETLRASTVNVAAYLKMEDEAGKIQPGYRADFILLDENPLIDIRHARDVRGVFTRGRWYSQSDVENLLEEAENKEGN